MCKIPAAQIHNNTCGCEVFFGVALAFFVVAANVLFTNADADVARAKTHEEGDRNSKHTQKILNTS